MTEGPDSPLPPDESLEKFEETDDGVEPTDREDGPIAHFEADELVGVRPETPPSDSGDLPPEPDTTDGEEWANGLSKDDFDKEEPDARGDETEVGDLDSLGEGLDASHRQTDASDINNSDQAFDLMAVISTLGDSKPAELECYAASPSSGLGPEPGSSLWSIDSDNPIDGFVDVSLTGGEVVTDWGGKPEGTVVSFPNEGAEHKE